MNQKSAIPKDAAAVILLNQDASKVLWAQRNPKISFLGGWHAFPGGKVDAGDADVAVRNCLDTDLERFIVAAARELFEETGVLLARGGEKLTRGQRASLHDDLVAGRSPFSEILADWGLWIDAGDFEFVGHWTTPKFSPVRFKTRFFLARCPPKQQPYAAIGELQNVEFIEPSRALERWSDAGVLISPPVLISLKELAAVEEKAGRRTRSSSNRREAPAADCDDLPGARGAGAAGAHSLNRCAEILREKSSACDGQIHHIELTPRVICVPLRTDTLPPATHTNCFIVGRRRFVVIDAASKEDEELEKLFRLVDAFIESGFVCREIIVSHLHRDHFGGEMLLQKHLSEKFGLSVPVSAHRITAGSLQGKVAVEKFIEDEEALMLADEDGEEFELTALHTPGHARGHLCFYDAGQGFLLSSDNVVALGTVVIAPPEGNMSDYLSSLERMKNLPNLKRLCGSHGAAVFDARGRIEEYIAHRLEREKQVLEALHGGARTPEEIAALVYRGLDPNMLPLAVKSVSAHLEKLESDKLIPPRR